MRYWFGTKTRNERYRRFLLQEDNGLSLDPFTHTLTIGDAGDSSNYGFISGSYGAIDPTTADATTIVEFNIFSQILYLGFAAGAAPVGTGGTYTVTLGGDSGGPYVLTWSAFTADYRLNTGATDIRDLMAANVGQNMQVNIVGAP